LLPCHAADAITPRQLAERFSRHYDFRYAADTPLFSLAAITLMPLRLPYYCRFAMPRRRCRRRHCCHCHADAYADFSFIISAFISPLFIDAIAASISPCQALPPLFSLLLRRLFRH